MDGSNIPNLREKKTSPVRDTSVFSGYPEVSNGVTIRNLSRLPMPISYGAISGLIQKISKYPGTHPALWRGLLGVVFLDDKQIKRLNLKYLKTNRPTDVLAFEYSNNSADLAISLETAKRNARLYKTSLKKELIRYIIHGILHLRGYNDHGFNKTKLMLKKQEEIFKRITCNL